MNPPAYLAHITPSLHPGLTVVDDDPKPRKNPIDVHSKLSHSNQQKFANSVYLQPVVFTSAVTISREKSQGKISEDPFHNLDYEEDIRNMRGDSNVFEVGFIEISSKFRRNFRMDDVIMCGDEMPVAAVPLWFLWPCYGTAVVCDNSTILHVMMMIRHAICRTTELLLRLYRNAW